MEGRTSDGANDEGVALPLRPTAPSSYLKEAGAPEQHAR